jgi:hypothetical protein
MAIPEGWTDDMTIALPAGLTYEEVVDLILQSSESGLAHEQVILTLVKRGLGEDDAHLAVDRTSGGVVRAETRNMVHAPDRNKDPMARIAFDRRWSKGEPTAGPVLTPEHAPEPRRWWRFWR